MKKKSNESVNDALKRLSDEMTSGKIASDFASVDTANSEYIGRDGLSGYATQAADASVIKTQQSIGQTQGLNEIINSPEKLQSFLNTGLNNIKNTIGKEKAAEVKADLIKSGVLGADGKVNSENWVKAKSYLSANNLNSHNALVAGGVVMSGALGKNASVQVNALNSSSSGNKTDTYEDANTHHKGDQLDYDAIIDTFGNSTAGEIVKGIVGGAGLLGAIDMLSGGKVRKTFGAAKNKISNKVTGFSGRARGKGDDGKEKTFSPKNPTDVDEYLDNNPGAKSRVDYDLSGREPSGPKNPQSAETTSPRTNNATAPNIADDMTSPLNDINNYNIDSGGAHTKHPKISNFATAVEAKTSGMMDAFKKVPFIGKVVGLATIGATASQAYDEFTQGNYAKSALTMTSAIDVSGASDMALASMEARENLIAATRGRTVTGFGGGIGGELGGAWNRTVNAVSSLFGGNSKSSISPVAASALQGGGQIGANQINPQQFAEVLRNNSVKQEFATMSQEQKTGMYAPLDDGGQMQMKNEIQDIGTRVRNSNSSPEKMMDQLNEQLKDSDMFKQFEKDLKKIKRKK